jgi:uncharacterized protein YggU (UPF0235/DUF167 family)
LIQLLAQTLAVPKSSISLSAGGKSRTKQLRIITATLDEAERIVARLPTAQADPDSGRKL